MTSDNQLLERYTQGNSEAAFAELVQRHLPLVYSAALRQVAGDVHLAQDVTQTVFVDLARKASSLAGHKILTGWLYTSTHFAASKMLRGEHRRRQREEESMLDPALEKLPELEWEKLRPVLDDAMHQLTDDDREAILLRYFENRPFAEIGSKLEVNENAARMRVERALKKLRDMLGRRGITTTANFASVLSANAIHLAPGGLGRTITAAALAGAGSGAFNLLNFMTTTKFALGVAAIITAGAATALVAQHQTQQKLAADNTALQQQVSQLEADTGALSNRVAQAVSAQALSKNQLDELLRLRAENDRLRQQAVNAALAASHAVYQAKLLKPDPDLPVVLEAPTVPLRTASEWRNLGTAAAADTLETLYWAMANHDQAAFAPLVAWDEQARPKAEALFAAAPDAVRQQFGTIDGVLYAMLSRIPPITGFAVVSQNVQGDDSIVVEQHQYEDGRVRQNQVSLHHFNDGWRIVFGDEKAMRGFDASLKFAADQAASGPAH